MNFYNQKSQICQCESRYERQRNKCFECNILMQLAIYQFDHTFIKFFKSLYVRRITIDHFKLNFRVVRVHVKHKTVQQ